MRRLRPLLTDDSGIALPIVVGLAMVMAIAIAAGLTTALSGLRQAATNEDRSAAYDAAYAGVQDYLVRINADPSYGSYGNASAAFSVGSTFTTAPAVNPAFGVGASGTWATVQTGSGAAATCPGVNTPCFRYSVDNRQLASASVVRLQSTGRVYQSVRTIVVEIRRKGFNNYLWFTDYEVQDPAISGKTSCAVYAWAAARDDGCRIWFGATDVLGGAVHSNDTISTRCTATFKRLVTTADPSATNYNTGGAACGSPGPFLAGKPVSVSKIDMPATNRAMKAQTRSDLVTTTGCLYTGPTVVTYLGDGYMKVWSPWTKFTNMSSATTGTNPADKHCGVPGTDPGQLGNASGATVKELATNLLYVQSVQPSPDPNYSSPTSIPAGMKCYGATGTNDVTDSTASAGWKFGPNQFPMAGEAAPDGWDGGAGIQGAVGGSWVGSVWSTTRPAYGCRNGDLFVSGKVTTQTTAASDDYVYVTGDLKYDKSTEDVLGLAGDNAVLVWNPVDATGANLLASDKDREIDAAILSTLHSFQVQNYNLGSPRGTLTVLGSIAQKFRGTVATTSAADGSILTGYRKDYQYHDLLQAVPPPYFLAPATTTFGARQYMSVAPAWQWTGAP